jgi:hypothetical protein
MAPIPVIHRSFFLLTLVATAACQVTPERLAAWKATPEGREKIVAALRDGKLDVQRRAQAAAALTEVGWVDRVESAVAGLPFEDRAQLIPAVVPLVAPDLAASDAARAWETREVLFALRRQSTTDEGTRSIDAQLLPALERDLRANHVEGGRHSAKEMLIAIGGQATPVAARVIADAKAPFDTAVEILDKVGDKAAREQAGAALVARARGGAAATPAFWQALGTLGGQSVIAFLQEKTEKGTGDEADEAARTLVKVRHDRTLLPFALKLAGDGEGRPVVREQMLALAQSIGGEDARKGLLELIGREHDAPFRFRIYETLVKADAKAIVQALEAFPADASYEPGDVRDHLVAPLVGMGWPAREGIFKSLQSRSTLARLTAVWALEKVGFDSDAAQVAKLTADRGKVKGLPVTIGAEATRVSGALKKPKA